MKDIKNIQYIILNNILPNYIDNINILYDIIWLNNQDIYAYFKNLDIKHSEFDYNFKNKQNYLIANIFLMWSCSRFSLWLHKFLNKYDINNEIVNNFEYSDMFEEEAYYQYIEEHVLCDKNILNKKINYFKYLEKNNKDFLFWFISHSWIKIDNYFYDILWGNDINKFIKGINNRYNDDTEWYEYMITLFENNKLNNSIWNYDLNKKIINYDYFYLFTIPDEIMNLELDEKVFLFFEILLNNELNK